MSSDVMTASTTHTLQLRAGLHPLTVLQLVEPQLPIFREQLQYKIQQAPKFFENAPIVLDLSALAYQEPALGVDFEGLKKILLDHRLIPVGVKHGTPALHAEAVRAGFAILQDNLKTAKTSNESGVAEIDHVKQAAPLEIPSTTLITTEVRSGQQIHAPNGDLIVLGPVSSGAELLADGHIHVYNTLRGRAMAGVNGNRQAHIFCQKIEAELISIAGQHLLSEDIEKEAWGVAVDITFQHGQWQFRPL